MPSWAPVSIETPKAAEAAADRRVRLPEDFVTEFDTRREEAPAEREAFFHWLNDPLPCFTGNWREEFLDDVEVSEGAADELDGLYLEGVESTWKVFTVIRNHHRRLNPRINTARVTLSYEEETAYVSIDKQLDGSS